MDVFGDLFVPLFTMKENNDIVHYNNETNLLTILKLLSPW